jgi:hypothetical protein
MPLSITEEIISSVYSSGKKIGLHFLSVKPSGFFVPTLMKLLTRGIYQWTVSVRKSVGKIHANGMVE